MTAIPYKFSDQIVIRTPKYPYINNYEFTGIQSFTENIEFMEAIYIASPDLYYSTIKLLNKEIKSTKDKNKIIASLLKYFTRMYSRSTPFGLFSNCIVGNWDFKPNSMLLTKDDSTRHSRLDMYYLYELAQKLAELPFIKEKLLFHTNTSHYFAGKEVRYVEYSIKNSQRSYRLSGIKLNPHLVLVAELCTKGIGITDICKILIKNGLSATVANNFVTELIDVQFLVNQFEPAITGPEYIYQVIDILSTINRESPESEIDSIISNLKTISSKLKKLDESKINDIEKYKEIIDFIKKLEAPYRENKLFQVDSFRIPTVTPNLNSVLQKGILDSLALLNNMGFGSAKENPDLTFFKKRFIEKYESKSIPFLEALDPDYGIGYPASKKPHFTPLIDDLTLPPPTIQSLNLKLSSIELQLHEQLVKAEGSKSRFEIDIEKLILNVEDGDFDDLPPSTAAIFRIVNAVDNVIYLESFSGPSAINLLSRFAHGNDEIKKLAQYITEEEEKLNSSVLFCEFVHLPESRASNVIAHPIFRKFELNYLAKSSTTEENKIDLSDVYLKIDNDQIILFSRKLNKRIIPRLSHVHNHFSKTLPVYHFIGDFQRNQLRSDLGFTWGNLTNLFYFFPRVVFKKIILSPATWQFNKKQLFTSNSEIGQWLTNYNIPQLVLYCEGDNELLINFKNELSIDIWLDAIKNKEKITLKEFIYDEKTDSNSYITQCVAPLIKTKAVYGINNTLHHSSQTPIKRTFIPGTEWLYYKLYSGSSTLDNIIVNIASPLADELLSCNLIKKWFFIKYEDPESHLRLRFHLTDLSNHSKIVAIINGYLRSSNEKDFIWRIQTDTYVREVERYGSNTIALIENIFYHESRAATQLLKLLSGKDKENIRWLWCLKSIDSLLDSFSLTLSEKQELLSKLHLGLMREFKVDKGLQFQINNKFRVWKPDITDILETKINSNQHLLFSIINERNLAIKEKVEEILTIKDNNQLEVNWNAILGSIIHMQLNRVLNQNARLQEMVIYDFIIKHYNYLKSKKEVTT